MKTVNVIIENQSEAIPGILKKEQGEHAQLQYTQHFCWIIIG